MITFKLHWILKIGLHYPEVMLKVMDFVDKNLLECPLRTSGSETRLPLIIIMSLDPRFPWIWLAVALYVFDCCTKLFSVYFLIFYFEFPLQLMWLALRYVIVLVQSCWLKFLSWKVALFLQLLQPCIDNL